MHISDVAIQCAHDCAQLARETGDPSVAERLTRIAKKLSDAAQRDAELVFEQDLTVHPSGERPRTANLKRTG